MDKGDKQGSSALDTGARKWQRNRRLLAVAFFMMAFMFGGVSATVYAVDCTKDTVIDQFGDWFGNLGKPARTKNRKRSGTAAA